MLGMQSSVLKVGLGGPQRRLIARVFAPHVIWIPGNAIKPKREARNHFFVRIRETLLASLPPDLQMDFTQLRQDLGAAAIPTTLQAATVKRQRLVLRWNQTSMTCFLVGILFFFIYFF